MARSSPSKPPPRSGLPYAGTAQGLLGAGPVTTPRARPSGEDPSAARRPPTSAGWELEGGNQGLWSCPQDLSDSQIQRVPRDGAMLSPIVVLTNEGTFRIIR